VRQVLTTMYEIQTGMWLRNGTHISTQALAYKQYFFCTFYIDADVSLLQVRTFHLLRITSCLIISATGVSFRCWLWRNYLSPYAKLQCVFFCQSDAHWDKCMHLLRIAVWWGCFHDVKPSFVDSVGV